MRNWCQCESNLPKGTSLAELRLKLIHPQRRLILLDNVHFFQDFQKHTIITGKYLHSIQIFFDKFTGLNIKSKADLFKYFWSHEQLTCSLFDFIKKRTIGLTRKKMM